MQIGTGANKNRNLSPILLAGLFFVCGCGGGGGGGTTPAATTATGTIEVSVVLTDPTGVTDFSGVSVSVSSKDTAPVTEITKSNGKLTFSGLQITSTATGTLYTVSAVKADYNTSDVTVPLAKNGDVQNATLSLQFSSAKLVSQTWPQFSSAQEPADFLPVLESFKEAVDEAKTADEISQSNTGFGWACFLGGFVSSGAATCNYQTAKASFEKAIATDNNTDAKVGLAFMLVDNATDASSASLADLETATGHGDQVLASNSTYSFAYATQFNYLDIHAMLAYAYSKIYISPSGTADDRTNACTHAKLVPASSSNCDTVCAVIPDLGSCTLSVSSGECSCP